MMLDLVDMTGSDLNNNILTPSCPVFRWPQHSFLIEHFRDGKPTLSNELQSHLEGLEIFAKEETSKNIEGKIASAARTCGLIARKKIWFSFDIFLSRNRPGLLSDPEAGLPKRKRKRRGKKKNKKVKDKEEKDDTQENETEDDVIKDDIISITMKDNIMPILEEELFIRAI